MNPDIIKLNTLEPRSYFIPFSSKELADKTDLVSKRYISDKVICLNGEWDFKHYSNPNDISDFDTENIDFDKIDVPSCIEYRGYEKPEYINARYNFLFNPPKVPILEQVNLYYSLYTLFRLAPNGYYNHTSMYRKIIDIKLDDKIYILSFLGVSNSYDLYVNGKYVGYAEESHNTSEFDISEYLVDGKNEIVVLVHRWSQGSYLECQDMFRNTGIFRDVLLRVENKDDIYDLGISYIKHDNLYDLNLEIISRDNIDVKVTLELDKKICEDIKLTKGLNKFSFKDLSVVEWNAEKPTLYNLYLEKDDFCIKERVGFKDIKVIGNTYLLNGNYIKFKGVNHHDTSPINGYTLSAEEIIKDLKICKEYNIDTVRTSHYAPDPLLIEAASELGIYIIDEVDLETHGAFFNGFPMSMSLISKNPIFLTRYLSRAKSHFERDKINTTPIVMWSLGNESGDGDNIYKMYEYFKSKSDIPVHYEGATHSKRKAYDIASEMYPTVSNVHLVGECESKTKEFNDRPYFLCEYAHAMGVGPGNIEGYWKEIYSHINLIGGCIWEMVDHSFYKDGEYLYGGDNGEWIHDSNFCCDGLFYPDRTPSTGALLAKYTYRPIRITHINDNEFMVFNTMAFTNSNDFEIEFIDSKGSHIIETNINPLSKDFIKFNTNDKMIDIIIKDKYNNIVSNETLVIDNKINVEYELAPKFPSWFKFDEGYPFIREDTFRINASKPYTLLYRALTDNDTEMFIFKPMKMWYKEKEKLINVKETANSLYLTYEINVGFKKFIVDDKYLSTNKGVLVESKIKCVRGSGYYPRFSKQFSFDKSFNKCKWFGRDHESYIDMNDNSNICVHESDVKNMIEPNIRPQESGNRMDCEWVEISNYNSIFRVSAVDMKLEIGVKPYSDKELIDMKHRSDELFSHTYLTVNLFNQGIGTGSCGPNTLKEHKYSVKNEYTLKFMVEVLRK